LSNSFRMINDQIVEEDFLKFDPDGDQHFSSVHFQCIPHNIVLQGGGLKGLAHLGALKFMYFNNVFNFGEQKSDSNRDDSSFRRVIGSSAGALMGLIFIIFNQGFRGESKGEIIRKKEVSKVEK
jgi:Patatin-like phospholipase